jgi:hypothetical protein
MKFRLYLGLAGVLVLGLQTASEAIGDGSPRAMGLAGSYTALARGPEAVQWNPANLGLRSSPSFKWELINFGLNISIENNAFSVQTYNDNFTDADHFIGVAEKRDLLSDVPHEGLRFNTDLEPFVALGVALNGGVAFPLPKEIQSAITTTVFGGMEGELPKDMFELMVFGNQFEGDRISEGLNGNYDISEWDGSGWAIVGINWAFARPVNIRTNETLKPYLRELSVGATLKVLGGAYSEVVRSGGDGFVSRVEGTDLESYVIGQSASGFGFGIDLGVAAVLKDGKTTVSVGLLDFLDSYNWSGQIPLEVSSLPKVGEHLATIYSADATQDCVFVTASDLRVTSLLDVENAEDIFDNPDVDGDGDVDFSQEIGSASFSRSLPARLRIGVSHQPIERLTVMGNYDQAFSSGFGLETTPRVSFGAEYRLVPWFPARIGMSVGGRSASSAIGFAFGPFSVFHMQLQLLDTALSTRGGVLPGAAKGSQISVMLFRFNLI